MTIQRAREILGDDIAHFSDQEVAKLNNETASYASDLLKFIVKDLNKKRVVDLKHELM